jgi:uncharacterized protein (TIGR03643 family)
MKKMSYSPELIHEVISLAWADEISFDAIKKKLGLSEAEVITVMRRNLKPGSFRVWRKRVTGRKAKHLKMMRPKGPHVEEIDDVAI